MQGEELQGMDMGRMSAAWGVLWAGRAQPQQELTPSLLPSPRTWRCFWTNW